MWPWRRQSVGCGLGSWDDVLVLTREDPSAQHQSFIPSDQARPYTLVLQKPEVPLHVS